MKRYNEREQERSHRSKSDNTRIAQVPPKALITPDKAIIQTISSSE
jgi:hypothetical protein